MYIDKSFQLLSADSGKVASDETRRQNAGDDDAEFSEMLGAELNQQEQSKQAENAAGTDHKAGQEVAALLLKQAKTAGQLNFEKHPADNEEAAVPGSEQATNAVASDHRAAAAAVLDIAATELTIASGQTQSTKGLDTAADTVADTGAEQTADSDPWLAIISQSHDFNELLSQSSAQPPAAAHGVALSSTATLVADVLGVPTTDKATSAAASALTKADQATANADSEATAAKTGRGEEPANRGIIAKTLSDNTVLNIAAEQQAAGIAEAVHKADDELLSAEPSKTGSDSSAKLPAEQVTVREMTKVDQPHLQTRMTGTAEQEQVTDTAQQALSGAASGAVTMTPTTQLQMTAATVLEQQNQTESNTAKYSATAPIDVELPITEVPDIAVLGSVVAESVKGTATAKNAPQSFAQFQKAANAAAALVQKQQLQAEQKQQPLQDLATQQPQKLTELNQVVPGAHADTPIAFNTLLQTERPISSGAAMGSSTGQQQQQAASQLFAGKLTETVRNNEPPALNLLEPNAAGQLKERVMFQVNQKIHSAEIKLAPEELGSMQIKVQLQQEQLSVQFVVQQAGAKEALEQQMPRLREMLEQQGLELTEGQVSQQREGSEDQRQARERTYGMGNGAERDDEPQQQQVSVRVSERMVDYYA